MIKDRICQHLQMIGIPPKESARFASLVNKWNVSNGPEWTVERLKGLKQSFWNRIQSENDTYVPSKGWKTKLNRHGNLIYDDGLVHRLLSSKLTPKMLKRVEAFLRVYQVFMLDKPSKSQLSKMEIAITSEPVFDIEKLVNYCTNHTKVAKISRIDLEHLKLESERSSIALPYLLNEESAKSSPYIYDEYEEDIDTISLKTSSRQKPEAGSFLQVITYDGDWSQLWKKYPNEIGKRLLDRGNFPFIQTARKPEEMVDFPIGKVSIIQSEACKARWVANPMLFAQALGEPLKHKLFKYSSLVYPEIRTADSAGAHQKVSEWLSTGKEVWSFDCSSFTDRFPLVYQRSVLDRLKEIQVVSQFDIDCFDIVMKKRWQCDALGRDVTWLVGQPLGYGPSFHLATLAHAVLLRNLAANAENVRDSFMVVGDDIVINNKILAHLYKNAMSDMGVSINLEKSLISNKYSEFLGKLVTVEGVNPSIKTRVINSEEQYLDTIPFYGPSILNLESKFSRRESSWLNKNLSLPEDLGGLQWRKRGSYSDWVASLSRNRHNSIQRMRLRKTVGEFTSLPKLRTTDTYNLLTRFYEMNTLNMSPTEWALLEQFSPKGEEPSVLTMNAMSNLPVSVHDVVSSGEETVSSQYNTLTHIVDNSIALGDASGEILLNQHGHISNEEKPFTRPIFTNKGEVKWNQSQVTKPEELNLKMPNLLELPDRVRKFREKHLNQQQSNQKKPK